MKRTLALVALAVLVLLGAVYLFHPFGLFPSRTTEKLDITVVITGSVSSNVNATGTIEPVTRVNLNFDGGGRVAAVLVETGQRVNKGDVLARLDASDVALSLRQAEASLKSAEARLAQTKKGAAAADLAAAEAGILSARANLDQLLLGPSSDQTATARANLERAQANAKLVQAAYDRVAWMPNIGSLPQSLQLQQATIDLQMAEANYRVATQGPSDSTIRSAEAAIAQAKAQLERLKSTPSPEDVIVAEAQAEQSRVSVEQARRRVQGTELTAPFGGIVEDVNLKVGQTVSAAGPVVVLVDVSAYELNVNVDETDVRQLVPGQPASITLDALPSVKLGGKVTHLSPGASLQNGVVAYVARVALDPNDAPLRPGMSANVAITVASRDNAVLLSNRGIQIDRDTGEKYVLKRTGERTEAVPVRTGIRDDFNTEILSGLQAGDQVVILSASSAAADALRSSLRGGR